MSPNHIVQTDLATPMPRAKIKPKMKHALFIFAARGGAEVAARGAGRGAWRDPRLSPRLTTFSQEWVPVSQGPSSSSAPSATC